jgi:hypothetical protein
MGRKKGPRSAAERLTRTLIQMFFLILLGKSGSARAQEPPIQIENTIDASPLLDGEDFSHGRISIDVTVSDGKGSAVTGLHERDFTLLDNGKTTDLVTFEPPDAHPDIFTVILVIDGVDMSPDELSDADRVALEFREERCPGNLR